MTSIAKFFHCLVGILVAIVSVAQQAPAPSRDAQAIAVLSQCVSASGGSAVNSIQDFTANGAITYYWAGEPVQGSTTVRAKDLTEFRVDASLPDGTQSWVVSGLSGSLTRTNGQISRLPFYNILNAGVLSLPVVRVSNALNDTTIGLIYVGLVTTDAGQLHQIRIIPPPPSAVAAAPDLTDAGNLDVFVDSATFQIVKTSEWVRDQGRLSQTYAHEMSFSNYQTVSGVLVPFGVSETIGGQLTWAVAINTITFNTGLTDSMFQP